MKIFLKFLAPSYIQVTEAIAPSALIGNNPNPNGAVIRKLAEFSLIALNDPPIRAQEAATPNNDGIIQYAPVTV